MRKKIISERMSIIKFFKSYDYIVKNPKYH